MPQFASAQSRTRVWDIAFGTSVANLPFNEFVDPACGTNGGPPSLPLDSLLEFARCPVEPATGLREVWFIYDDEWEYIARAYRDPLEIGRYSANTLFRQPIMTSLMIDAAGLVQGFRVITDTRAPIEVRLLAHDLYPILKGMFNDAPWMCVDLPPGDREAPHEGLFIKANCEQVAPLRYMKAEGRHMHKPGQDVREAVRLMDNALGAFESSARLEVYSRAAVTGAACCRASARP
jgi:hypothetical protein